MDRSWLGVEKAIEGALAEDLGLGDVTTDAIVPPASFVKKRTQPAPSLIFRDPGLSPHHELARPLLIWK